MLPKKPCLSYTADDWELLCFPGRKAVANYLSVALFVAVERFNQGEHLAQVIARLQERLAEFKDYGALDTATRDFCIETLAGLLDVECDQVEKCWPASPADDGIDLGNGLLVHTGVPR